LIAETPRKYESLKNADVKRSFQHIIDSILEFKEKNPHVTERELHIFAIGSIDGRTKQKKNRRNIR